MKTVNILLCGLGGQGILFMTKILARAAIDKGFGVMGAETHGMAQRGGSVVSHLRLGDAKGTLVRAGTADLVLALEENEGYRNLSFLHEGASLYVNTSSQNFPRHETRPYLDKQKITYYSLPASVISQDMGAPRSSNLALLGFYSGFSKWPLGHNEIKNTIEKISPKGLRDLNMKVFEAGYKKAENY